MSSSLPPFTLVWTYDIAILHYVYLKWQEFYSNTRGMKLLKNSTQNTDIIAISVFGTVTTIIDFKHDIFDSCALHI